MAQIATAVLYTVNGNNSRQVERMFVQRAILQMYTTRTLLELPPRHTHRLALLSAAQRKQTESVWILITGFKLYESLHHCRGTAITVNGGGTLQRLSAELCQLHFGRELPLVTAA